MEDENFYCFIKSLSKGEKSNYSKLFGKDENNETALFKALNNLNSWNEKGKNKINNSFDTPSLYYKTRRGLAIKILKSQLYFEKQIECSFGFIERAIQNQLFKIASNVIEQITEELDKKGDLLGLKHFIEFAEELEFKYCIVLKIDPLKERYEDISRKLSEERMLKKHLKTFTGYGQKYLKIPEREILLIK